MSKKYNSFERSVAKLLSKFPVIKKISKAFYSRLNYLLNKPSSNQKSDYDIVEVGNYNSETFFGYYDKSPMNSSGLTLCCISLTKTSKKPLINQLKIVVIDKNNDEICHVNTNTYNWQQGPRCFWLSDDLFIFNDFCNDLTKYVAKVFSVDKKKVISVIDAPAQDSFKDKFVLSINYQRLMTLRPDYGYRNLELLDESDLLKLDNDGIWKFNLCDLNVELIISLEKVVNFKPKVDYKQFFNKVNHVMISPDGTKFIFIHRYLKGKQRFDRLILSDANGKLLRVLADNEMVSHCNWLSNSEIIGYLRGPDGADCYYKINVNSCDYEAFDIPKLGTFGDGHPSRKGDWVVTDSYPDKSRIQTLYMFNYKTNELKILAELFHGFSYDGESRCDLHPRVSMDGKRVYFDTVFSGKRKLAYVDVDL